MDADLDTLCTVVYCTADDLLPEARRNARRRITHAEVVTLCVASRLSFSVRLSAHTTWDRGAERTDYRWA